MTYKVFVRKGRRGKWRETSQLNRPKTKREADKLIKIYQVSYGPEYEFRREEHSK